MHVVQIHFRGLLGFVKYSDRLEIVAPNLTDPVYVKARLGEEVDVHQPMLFIRPQNTTTKIGDLEDSSTQWQCKEYGSFSAFKLDGSSVSFELEGGGGIDDGLFDLTKLEDLASGLGGSLDDRKVVLAGQHVAARFLVYKGSIVSPRLVEFDFRDSNGTIYLKSMIYKEVILSAPVKSPFRIFGNRSDGSNWELQIKPASQIFDVFVCNHSLATEEYDDCADAQHNDFVGHYLVLKNPNAVRKIYPINLDPSLPAGGDAQCSPLLYEDKS